MKKHSPHIFLFIASLFIASSHSQAQESSVLASGTWYKLATQVQGVHKIDYNLLKTMGVDVDNINPKNIQLYGNGGKVLPQSNSTNRPNDLIQNAIQVVGEADDSFDNSDYILFYATNIDSTYFDPVTNEFVYKNHPYEEQAYYFLTVASSAGLRVATEQDQGDGFPKITSYDYYDIYEEDKFNILISGREWYGDRFDITTSYSYPFNVTNLTSDGLIKVTSSVMAQSYAPSSFDVTLNSVNIGNQEIASVIDYIYGLQGRNNVATLEQPINQVNNNGSNWDVVLTYNKNESDRSLGYLNYLIFQAERRLTLENEQINFRSLKSLDNPFSTFELQNINNTLQVWDVTSSFYPKIQEYTINGTLATYGVSTMELKEFTAFNVNSCYIPLSFGPVTTQNLRGETAPEVLIVTHPDFKEHAQRLADFRSQHDGYTVTVATTTEVFNEFSSGSQDPSAIRDIAKYYYDQNSLKHLLLFGKCSYDFKEIKNNNTNYVPTYPSRNSLHPLKTYSSDDYYGFLEETEGEWIKSASGDHTLDIGVGRLPVTTEKQAREIVDKLIRYDSHSNVYGNWRNNVYFVADDGEVTGSLHHKQADQLTIFADTTYSSFNTKKIFLDSYQQVSRSSGVVAPKVNEAINSAIDNGALIINYTGHGGENGWAQEGILDLFMIDSWTNQDRLPLFVTATCEFGRHDDPARSSGGERTVLNPFGGGIAIVTTGRPVNSGSNFLLNKAFYQNIFKKIDGRYPTLGEVFIGTKNQSLNGSSNRNFSLLGDPSMTLAYPEKEIIIDEITTAEGDVDTLKALSRVKIQGHINNSESFQGTAQITVFDKQSPLQTLGNENPVYNYKEWENVIFQGYSIVNNGSFTSEFIVPKSINYELDHGKISIYAVDDNLQTDANGSNIDVVIGGSSNISTIDETAPEISLFINDTTNHTQIIGSNILLFVKLTDESGINISNFGIGSGLEAVLDDSISFDLSPYYNASEDTYKTGWVLFPIENLATGEHSIRINASDTYNNVASETLYFYVNASELIISDLYNYPNPVNSNTTFVLSHNFSGDHLEIELTIYKPNAGVLLRSITDVVNINETIEFAECMDILNQYGDKLEPGIYIYGVSVRSLSKGVKNRKFQKLIITN